MRSIGFVTTSRADYSSLLPVLRIIENDSACKLLLFVGGTHLAPEFGLTEKEIETDGFCITDRIQMLLASDTPQAAAKAIGLGVLGLADSLTRFRPDVLLIVGDRYELLSVACTALLLDIPLAHISGGDVTEGAIDNQVRHAISKMSHVHFVAMQEHANRLRQMGEEPRRVHITGDPALDLLHQIELMETEQLRLHLGLDLVSPVIIVTFHPTTLGLVSVQEEIDCLMAALEQIRGTLIFTSPNADAQGWVILERYRDFCARRPGAGLYSNLGQKVYYSLLSQADLMVGNSSSGIWEAPSFRLPVVNVGERQRGRLRACNVIDVKCQTNAIREAIEKGLDPGFRISLEHMQNPYGDGKAAPRIVQVLKEIELGKGVLQKQFIDLQIC